MVTNKIENLLLNNEYPGRGIIVGMTPDSRNAVTAYFIMGRSSNSRNRIFERFEGGMRTKAYDESKVSDPSLIIYNPFLESEDGKTDIVTNGDQTDTIFDFLKAGKSFEDALRTRSFEPDAPNFTPRISAVLEYGENTFIYRMSILKSSDMNGSGCNRYFFDYQPVPGEGRFIHTYRHNGNPIPSFEGEPESVIIPDDFTKFADSVWNSLNDQNKVSLFVRCRNLFDGNVTEYIYNKNVQEA